MARRHGKEPYNRHVVRNDRYMQQMKLADFGERGQRAISEARVLVVGAGGLGSPALLYLAGAGVGTIGIIDNDVVAEANLHRQVIHHDAGAGTGKAMSAAQAVTALNPLVHAVAMPQRLDAAHAHDTLHGWDAVLDCSDNFSTRYLIDAVCVEYHVPVIWGAVAGFYGQVSVFGHGYEDGKRGTRVEGSLRDLYPVEPQQSQTDDPHIIGTFGPLCGITGSMMAGETLKLIGGFGELLVGMVALVDARRGSVRTVHYAP